MKNNFKRWFIIGSLFIIILGSLSHFIYEWSNYNKFVGLFVAVNESVWEHIKLAIFSALILTLIRIPLLKNNKNFIAGIFISVFTIIVLIPLLFYGYKFILGSDYLILDILVFIISVIIGEYLFYKILSYEKSFKNYNLFYMIGIFLILICYLTFSYYPLKSFLFEDPIDKTYGINKLDK